MKIYIEQCKGDVAKDIIKIRLYMWNLKKNYKNEEKIILCPLCEIEDTTEHVLNWGINTDKRQKNIKNNTEEEWEEVVQIFRESKRKREKRREKV